MHKHSNAKLLHEFDFSTFSAFFKCTNAQMDKCPNGPVVQWSNGSNTQMLKWSNAKMHKTKPNVSTYPRTLFLENSTALESPVLAHQNRSGRTTTTHPVDPSSQPLANTALSIRSNSSRHARLTSSWKCGFDVRYLYTGMAFVCVCVCCRTKQSKAIHTIKWRNK